MTTAGDVGHYFVALLNGGAYERPSHLAGVDRPDVDTRAGLGSESYGFGWNEMRVNGMRLLSHAGDIGGGGAYGSSGRSSSSRQTAALRSACWPT